MGKPTRYEHYVPKEHIRRFSDIGNIHVTRYTGESFQKRINERGMFEIGGITNFYDADDPYDDQSVENRLAELERTLQTHMDKVITDNIDYSGGYATMEYISLLYNRSIFKRESCRQFAPTDEGAKKLHELAIGLGIDFIGLEKIDDFKCGVQTTSLEEYITSDNPVVCLNSWDFRKEVFNIEENTIPEKERRKESVFICPLSPTACAFMYHNETKYSEQFIREGYYTVENVNRHIAHWAIEWILSKSAIADNI